MSDDVPALLNGVRESPLDQAGWAALADALVEAGDQAGYDAVTGKVLSNFDRFLEYEERRARGEYLFYVKGRGVSYWCSPGRADPKRAVQTSRDPYDPVRDVRWWVLYVANRDYVKPNPKATATPRMAIQG